jgi:putative phosphoribosyl transferase
VRITRIRLSDKTSRLRALALSAPLDLVLVRKLGTLFQPELAMGAVADGGSPVIVRNEDVIAMVGIGEAEFEVVCRFEIA